MAGLKDDTVGKGLSLNRTALSEVPAPAVGDILGLLAHDLRNPLAALSSNVGFLGMLQEELTEDAREAVLDLQLSIEALGRIIDSLELVCTELKDSSTPSPLASSVRSLIDALFVQAERAAESHGVRLEVEFGEGPDWKITVSEQVFLKGLSALVHNAITAAPAGSSVRLSVFEQDGEVLFRVVDKGVPLDPKLVQDALTADGQSKIKTAAGGRYSRGLGLYVASRCAELAGARFSIAEAGNESQLEISAPLA